MDKMLDIIKEDIDKVKVIEYEEKPLAAESKFIGVILGKYKLNNGETIIRESVTKKAGTGNAVCVFAVTEEKKIIVVVQPRAALDTDTRVNIEIPAGYKEVGETAVETGLRELVEETGYASNNVILLDTYYPSLGASGEKRRIISIKQNNIITCIASFFN